MSRAARIIVLGGYGGFGKRIAVRLAAAGHDVIVAGRSLDQARAFCAEHTGLQPRRIDRDEDLRAVLAQIEPALLVDASGPFQGASYAVAQACIESGVHYVDIADAREFVRGIGALDRDAQGAGVAVIAGASSVPALSGAAVRALADGMSVSAVEIAISASNRASAGASVAAAILDYVGRPIPLRRGGRRRHGYGWQEMRRLSFFVEGTAPIIGRRVALADVPDLDLLPTRLSGRPAVTFRAGTELSVQMLALWLASWLVRWRLIGSLRRLAAWVRPLQRLTAPFGSDRSAMVVRVFGTVAERRIERRWTLIADAGDGPEIPALSVPIIVARILAGHAAVGARDAGMELRLTDYDDAFASLAVQREICEIEQRPPLYARVMGARYDRLPPALRSLHAVLRDAGASGGASVTAGRNAIARLVARIVGFPPPGDHELHVHFTEQDGVETWTRTFSGKSFRSALSQRGPWLIERFGPLSFAFDLPSDDRGLTMAMRAWWIGPLRLPLALAPRSEAREWEEGGLFRFDVPIRAPMIGEIIHYRGWLRPPQGPQVGSSGE